MQPEYFKSLHEKGYSFEVFRGDNDNPNSVKVENILKGMTLDQGIIQRVEKIQTSQRILCFGENWCPDCMINETVVHKLGQHQPLLDIRYLPREGYEELISSYDKEGKARIPLIMVMDANYRLKGTFNEVPSVVREVVENGNQAEVIVIKRKYRNGELIHDTCIELLELMEKEE